MRTLALIMLTSLGLLAPPGLAQADAETDSTPRTFNNADELLIALETEGEDLTSLAAAIRYTNVDALASDLQQRLGSLVFTRTPRDRFRLSFKRRVLGERVEDDKQDYIFDGVELVEVYPDNKQMVRRRVVGAGEDAIDPFDLEQGPFPLPFGQKRDAILSKYTATLVDPGEGLDIEPEFESLADRAREGGWVQLRLEPRGERPEFESDELSEIRLWYDPADERLLPTLGMTVNGLGDIKLMEFFSVRHNPEIAESEFFTEPPEGEGWDVVFVDMVVGAAERGP